MKTPHEAFDKAKIHLRNADHLLTMTYPLVRDPKLLYTIANNLFQGTMESLKAMLYYERQQGLPPFHESTDSIIHTFQAACAKKYNLADNVSLVEELKDIVSAKDAAPMEFNRKDLFVMANKDYKMKTLSEKQMKDLVAKAKTFFTQINNILQNAPRIA